jgi:hypothetical protein
MGVTAIQSPIRTVSGNQPIQRRIIEKAGQTFLMGTPVMLDTGTGSVKAWDGTTLTAVGGIIGASAENANNLTTTGVAQQPTFPGTIPFQTNAANISRPYFNTGDIAINLNNPDTIFFGQVGPAQTTAATDVGVRYGMSIDTDNHWFVDKTKTTVGTNTCVKVLKLDPNDTLRGVHFQFDPLYTNQMA